VPQTGQVAIFGQEISLKSKVRRFILSCLPNVLGGAYPLRKRIISMTILPIPIAIPAPVVPYNQTLAALLPISASLLRI